MQFSVWYALHLAEVDDAEEHGELADVHETLGILMDMTRTLGPRHTLATPYAHTLEELLDLVAALGDEAAAGGETARGDEAEAADEMAAEFDNEFGRGERLEALVDVLAHYLDFLSETDSWRASDANFEASYQVLDDTTFADFRTGVLGALFAALEDAPVVPADAQLQALHQLPIITGVDGVLDWIGRGKPVTGTGGLRLADIAPVAALIDHNVVGKKGASAANAGDADMEMALDAMLGRPHSAGEPAVVGSMWDDAPLSTWWIALSLTGILDVGNTVARPGVAAARWRSADAAEHLAARIDFIDQYVQEWFENEAELDLEATPHVLLRVLTMLASAVTPEVLPELGTAAITDLVDEELGFELSFGASKKSGTVLSHLRAAGLVVPEPAADGTERFLVPEALRPAVRRGFLPSIASLMQR
ncbi:hypothetical protein [Microterricola viridarii]|uniref:Uncharacterized protein n=1 Tax=Microterricola viridarii TaxID=412690 RepID=A0A0X8E3R1_9MICO|nr:hypothetical protein [Microterricola viridarii]AMB59174.1 hypothetical protein AWU67_10220 [Microterricola viridarii]